MNETLKVIIEGDAKDLNAELNQAGQRVEGFAKKTSKANSSASKSFGTLKKSSANVTPTILEFNRVIQDAPFGIQGVANNITQLTQNFGDLQKSAGGTKNALKALVAGFAGPAGILFAVSAVTSLLVTYGDELFKVESSTSELTEATKELTGSVQSELTTLNALLSIARDEGRSKEDRQKAIDRINKEYDKYLPNLTTESVNTDKVKTAVDKLSESLLRQAKIKGLSNLLSEKFAQLAQLESQSALESASVIDQITASLTNFGNIGAAQADVVVKGFDRQQKEAGELNTQIESLQKTIQGLISEDITLGIESNGGGGEEIAENLGKATEISREFAQGLNFAKTGTVAFNSALNTLDDTAAATTAGLNQVSVDGLSTYNTALTQALAQTQIFTEAASAGFSALASQIANSLSTGNAFVDAFVSSILQSLAQLAAQFIATQLVEAAISQAGIAVKKEVANANAAVAATSAAAALGPFGLAALPGLLAGARGIVEASFASAKFATGGIVPGGSFVGDRTPILANGGEMIFNSRQQRNLFDMVDRNLQGGVSDLGGTVVFEVEGTRLVGVLNNASRQSRRNGGALRLT